MDESGQVGERVGLSSITLCEVVYLAEKERIRPDALELILDAVRAPDGLFEELPVDSVVASAMSGISRSTVPDMPDRIIAGTALSRGVPLITKDRLIHSSGIPVIW
jgi:predicted nucleic acid-binding protein